MYHLLLARKVSTRPELESACRSTGIDIIGDVSVVLESNQPIRTPDAGSSAKIRRGTQPITSK